MGQRRRRPHDPLTEPELLRFTMGQRRRRPHTRPAPTKQPPDPLTEPDLLRFTMGQRRRRPEPTSAGQATTRPSNGARSTAIYNGTASPAPTPDQSRPAPTKQPPDPLTEPELLRFTMGQRRRRPHPTRADQRRPSNHRPSNGARSTAIYNGTASPAPTPDQSRPAPTKQPPHPLTKPDLLPFTMEQRRRRPRPTRADQATTRPSNGARSTAIYNGTASPAPTPDQSRPAPTKQPPDPLTEPDLLRFTMEQRRRRPHPTSADQATTRPSNGATPTAIYNGTASPAPTPDQSRPAPTKQPPDPHGARSTAIYNGTASPAPTPDQSRPSNHPTL